MQRIQAGAWAGSGCVHTGGARAMLPAYPTLGKAFSTSQARRMLQAVNKASAPGCAVAMAPSSLPQGHGLSVAWWLCLWASESSPECLSVLPGVGAGTCEEELQGMSKGKM